MATKRIKDLTNTATTIASDEFLAVDGTTNGTSKITRDNFRQDTADAFVAAPGTYNLAPLSGGAVPIANGGTAATSAAAARTNLSVNSVDEDAEAIGTKLLGPSVYFDGTNDVVTVADDDKLTFSSSTEFGTNSSGTWSPDDNTPALTDGTGTLNQHYRVDAGAGTVTQGGSTLSVINGTATTAGQAVYYDGSVWRLKDVDDLPFTLSAWVKPEVTGPFSIVSKFPTSGTREWAFSTSGSSTIRLQVFTDSSNYFTINCAGATLSGYQGEWVHLAVAFPGAGPNSDNAFSATTATIYINGVALATSTAQTGTYSGMQNTSGVVQIGEDSSSGNSKGHIRNVSIYNRELTASEVADLARGNELGFADQWAGALGGVYTSDFSAGTNSHTAAGGAATGNIDAIGGQDDNLRLTIDSSTGNHQLLRNISGFTTTGQRYRFEADLYLPSANAVVDGIEMNHSGNVGVNVIGTVTATDTWTHVTAELVQGYSEYRIRMKSGSSYSFTGNGTDVIYVRNVRLTQLGTLADFRSERFDVSTGKWYDLSDNAFVGTNSGATLVGREVPVYETGTWTPTITFGGGSTGLTYSTQEGHYTRIGDVVHVQGMLTLSAKGSSTGNTVLAGLPYTSLSTTGGHASLDIGYATAMASLSTSMDILVSTGATTGLINQWQSTGISAVTHANFTNTSSIRFSGTYKIQ